MTNRLTKLEIFKLAFKELQYGKNKSSLFVRLILHLVKYQLFHKRAVSADFGAIGSKSCTNGPFR